MNRPDINKKSLIINIITIALCWNGSMVDTSKKDKRPDVNFYGILKDHTDHSSNIEDILIAGRYQNIPVYQIPQKNTHTSNDKTDLDPKTNKSLLDLSEILSVELMYPDKPIEHQQTFNNNKFSEIMVTTLTGSKQHYLIESNREISCVKIDKGPDESATPILEERKLNIIHVKKLEIKGKKGAIDTKLSHTRENEAESDVSKIASKTEKIIDEIEKNVENLNAQTNFEKFKQSLASMLRSLRDQLQKMLSLIKS